MINVRQAAKVRGRMRDREKSGDLPPEWITDLCHDAVIDAIGILQMLTEGDEETAIFH